MKLTRRALPMLLAAPALAQAVPKVVVIGGGFGGTSCARALQGHGIAVTLVEARETYTSCPFSNAVIAGLRPISTLRFGYEGLRRAGITVVHGTATGVAGREVVLGDGTRLPFDRLVVSPGITLRFDALPGYSEAASETLPHAWQAGAQTELLARQLNAMEDGGTVIMTVPENPYRCPPGPYERASLIAYFLKTRKPRSKLLVLDAKDAFSKQRLFEAAWAALYPGILEYVPLSGGGKVTGVDVGARRVTTDFGDHDGAVINVIPPQRAGDLARVLAVADRSLWCPIDPESFESRLVPGVHVIGDAAIAGAMPKSAFAANAQGRVCAAAVAALLRGTPVQTPRLLNTCYSLVAPGYGISIAGVYRPANGLLTDVPGAGGTSPLNAPPTTREAEAHYAEDWFQTITTDAFG
ncbi:NAD(P)/FAD-dependent oxidoreductase [Plastoroseomonas arctica]|uniref:FAD-dependent oxidoreductase n=1 Tax=Plastoroseomonas arctica TaxID=1509237 RepID=A0AAF1KRQ8_9PROT|nr:NAD(P)/FAD-dependent oxidoreductase [Plastoroseomonas arctica]MBR0654657.1 FAD-dependent oxidoreductase [Plastoroseomonas arctica]